MYMNIHGLDKKCIALYAEAKIIDGKPLSDRKRKFTLIRVPPETKRRAERVSNYLQRSVSNLIEDFAQTAAEPNMLARLPNDECRRLYLKKKLKVEDAFPGKQRNPKLMKFPDPPSGPHEPIAISMTLKSRLIFDCYCHFLPVTLPVVIARLFKNLERGLTSAMTEEKKAEYFAGRAKVRLPYSFDPLELTGEEDDDDGGDEANA